MSEKRSSAKRPPVLRINTQSHSSKEDRDTSNQTSSTSASQKPQQRLRPEWLALSKWRWPAYLSWIPDNWTWEKVRLSLRCAVAGWLSSLLFIIPTVQVWIGQASFLLLISAFLSPPADPFPAVFERELLILILVSATWGWSCLGMLLANLARNNSDSSISLLDALTSNGKYVETGPSLILAIFIFIGAAVLLYIRAHQGPGPYLFAVVFSSICLITNLTTAALIPYPYYTLGRTILIPLVFHSVIAVLTSIFIFPSSLSTNFTRKMAAVISPLEKAISIHVTLLNTVPGGDCVEEFKEHINALTGLVSQCEAALSPLAQVARLLPTEVLYSRFSPRDWRPLQDLARRIAARANGMTIYFDIIDPTRERFPVTPATTRPTSPASSRPGTPVGKHAEPLHHLHLSRLLHLHSWHHHHHRSVSASVPVGVFESLRYLDIEAHVFHDPSTEAHTTRMHALLKQSCTPLLEACSSATTCLHSWFVGASAEGEIWKVGWASLTSFINSDAKKQRRAKDKQIYWDEIRSIRSKLCEELEKFQKTARMNVVEPYSGALGLDTAEEPTEPTTDVMPSHRYLFHCYVYQYHLMRFADMLSELLDHVLRLETRPERRHRRIWMPFQSVRVFLKWITSVWAYHDGVGRSMGIGEGEEEDPDRVQHVDGDRRSNDSDDTILDEGDDRDNMYGMPLPYPKKRDPDALPPSNMWENIGGWMYKRVAGVMSGNALFAVKAAALTTLLSLPFFLRGSAQFAYENRFLWGIVMAQLTSARFRGDTTFGFLTRIFSTFLGGLVGLVMWYICAPTTGHQATPYALSAIFAVCFPFFFFVRLYIPGPPMRILIFFVTTVLVVGYSYQDQYQIIPSSPGVGWSVAWRRFLLVSCGVFAAFIFSFLPPTFTIRKYQRSTLATTCAEVGVIYCAILSLFHGSASDASSTLYVRESGKQPIGHSEHGQAIVARLIAIRGKLDRLKASRANVKYEISFRGRWPEERYHTLFELQKQISYSLSHFLSIIEHLEPAWINALLNRTRFNDPTFQGDVLAVTMISTALRTGLPLPQVTPCPLVDRFMLKFHGLNVIQKEAEEDYGLPRTLTRETLENEQYLMFCVGVSTAFGIVSRLDRLMVAAKEIVGEQYHIQCLGLGHGFGNGAASVRASGVPLGSRTSTRMSNTRGPFSA
ncbi:hypothetical protein GYMLUDRAFT_40270 [Collybiopsis luxurians FD-317 M1]|uniref:ER transporter 6TM N-terminal domain-containing protein n=1 Tax=Collybiopsis luxurians FD-317 M1 TaxID=944289 RepID=A0A0D0BIW3_9AGAR|nr:hypothetical protein GYMLUDRAFT_40270 [Collybiopsis luxurians FD-317 M1]